ncbi:hypothetical protein BJ878DRAFT_450635 [Calycina marina]|uniref:Uncharacterized protein n=1 Tax=Calycina marina TaxID=1763456 RepID=A0A9P7ZBY8_9HELO|nr:hypothetical protein BJ878DRAFT_450635 [Calycina marina]
MSASDSPTAWTLFLRHKKTIILILAEPILPIRSLKVELLEILEERYPNGVGPSVQSTGSSRPEARHPIPSSRQEIMLGILKNEYDHASGWEGIAADERETLHGLGLKDKQSIAFAFKGEGESEGKFEVEWPNFDDYEIMSEVDD